MIKTIIKFKLRTDIFTGSSAMQSVSREISASVARFHISLFHVPFTHLSTHFRNTNEKHVCFHCRSNGCVRIVSAVSVIRAVCLVWLSV